MSNRCCLAHYCYLMTSLVNLLTEIDRLTRPLTTTTATHTDLNCWMIIYANFKFSRIIEYSVEGCIDPYLKIRCSYPSSTVNNALILFHLQLLHYQIYFISMANDLSIMSI
jgi:hypothetical protein